MTWAHALFVSSRVGKTIGIGKMQITVYTTLWDSWYNSPAHHLLVGPTVPCPTRDRGLMN